MIGENLRKVREEKGFGVNQLSRMSGVNASYISALERGEKKNPGVAILKKLCDAMDISLEYLMDYEVLKHVALTTLDAETEDSHRRKKTNKTDNPARTVQQFKDHLSTPRFIPIPIVGSIRAGKPIFAEDNYLGTIPVMDNVLKRDGVYFGLIVKGDSMNLEFTEGTTLVIEKTPCLENGQIGVVRIDGLEATVKKIVINGSMITLIPMSTNPEHIPHMYNLETDDIEIIGKVIQAIKTY